MIAEESLRLWKRALIAILISLALLIFGRGKPAPAGATLALSTTIVPSDAKDLDCDASVSLGGERCAFSNGRHVPDVQRPFRPFITLQGELVLLSGVFENHEVSESLRATRRRRSNARLRLDCRSSYLGSFDSVGVRFRRSDPFEARRNVRAAGIEACTLSREKVE